MCELVNLLIVLIDRQIPLIVVVDVIILVIDISAGAVVPVVWSVPSEYEPIRQSGCGGPSPPVVRTILPTRVSPGADHRPAAYPLIIPPTGAEWQVVAVALSPIVANSVSSLPPIVTAIVQTTTLQVSTIGEYAFAPIGTASGVAVSLPTAQIAFSQAVVKLRSGVTVRECRSIPLGGVAEIAPVELIRWLVRLRTAEIRLLPLRLLLLRLPPLRLLLQRLLILRCWFCRCWSDIPDRALRCIDGSLRSLCR